ncbi:MAG: MlaD family protein, partial [Candidatus Zixiibacteriota bacterium]
MRRSNRVKWSELKVGVLLMFAFGLMMWASFFGGGTSVFQRKKHFHAHFESVSGLTPGSPVWMRGVEVGNVKSIEFDPERRKIEVVGKVKNSVWHMVSADSKVKIGAIGLIGDKYVDLIPGSAGAPPLEPDGELEVIEDDAEKIFREGASALEHMNALAADFKMVLEKINSGEGLIGKLFTDTALYDNLNRTLTELDRTLEQINANQSRAFSSLERGAESFEEIT